MTRPAPDAPEFAKLRFSSYAKAWYLTMVFPIIIAIINVYAVWYVIDNYGVGETKLLAFCAFVGVGALSWIVVASRRILHGFWFSIGLSDEGVRLHKTFVPWSSISSAEVRLLEWDKPAVILNLASGGQAQVSGSVSDGQFLRSVVEEHVADVGWQEGVFESAIQMTLLDSCRDEVPPLKLRAAMLLDAMRMRQEGVAYSARLDHFARAGLSRAGSAMLLAEAARIATDTTVGDGDRPLSSVGHAYARFGHESTVAYLMNTCSALNEGVLPGLLERSKAIAERLTPTEFVECHLRLWGDPYRDFCRAFPPRDREWMIAYAPKAFVLTSRRLFLPECTNVAEWQGFELAELEDYSSSDRAPYDVKMRMASGEEVTRTRLGNVPSDEYVKAAIAMAHSQDDGGNSAR